MPAKFLARSAVLALMFSPAAAMGAVTCTVAVSSVAFGNYEILNPGPVDATGAVNVTCTDLGGSGRLAFDLSVAISSSQTSGSTTNRQMAAGGSDRLAYNLYRDATYTQLWGDQPGLDDYVTRVRVPKDGSIQVPLTIFGRIPAGQDVAAGTYSDRVVLTVTP